jgi:hypothetical protein
MTVEQPGLDGLPDRDEQKDDDAEMKHRARKRATTSRNSWGLSPHSRTHEGKLGAVQTGFNSGAMKTISIPTEPRTVAIMMKRRQLLVAIRHRNDYERTNALVPPGTRTCA